MEAGSRRSWSAGADGFGILEPAGLRRLGRLSLKRVIDVEARSSSPMRIRLSDERRQRMLSGIRQLFAEEFDRELSDFQADRLLDFFVRHLGAPVYNQAIQDARSFFQAKLEDLEGEIYEPEESL